MSSPLSTRTVCENILFLHPKALRGSELRLVRTVGMVGLNNWRDPLKLWAKTSLALRPPLQVSCSPSSTQTNIIIKTVCFRPETTWLYMTPGRPATRGGINRAIATSENFKNVYICYIQQQVYSILPPPKRSVGCGPDAREFMPCSSLDFVWITEREHQIFLQTGYHVFLWHASAPYMHADLAISLQR